MRGAIYILGMCVVLWSCQREIDLELPGQSQQLVVEGNLHNGPGPHLIRLSTISSYYEGGARIPVTDAQVRLTDGEGNVEVLSQPEPGTYEAATVGEIGQTYTLDIAYQEQAYRSEGTLLLPPQLDSVVWEYRPPSEERREGYFVTLHGIFLTPQPPNLYRLKVWRNDTLYGDRNDYDLFNDRDLLGELDGMGSGHRYRAGDTVRVELHRLDLPMYSYYLGLLRLLYNDGGLFSPPPVNPPTNIRNLTTPEDKPLGFFQVSTRVGGEVIIPEE